MKRFCATFLLLASTVAFPLKAQPPFVGLGDSIGEGVQSANAITVSQAECYLNRFAKQMGAPFTLPLIQSGPLGSVYSTFQRSRVDPSVAGSNLSVSGADVHDLLYTQAILPIDNETDLVLSPRAGSQIQIAETLRAPFQICWIGNNDVLGSVVRSWDHLDGTQLTPISQFTADYGNVVQRLGAWNGKVLVGNLPDVTQIGFMFSPQDLVTFLGSDYGLQQGNLTTLPTMLLLKLGLIDGSVLQNPNFVLDLVEVQAIRQRTQEFNRIIAIHAAQAGTPVVDIAGLFDALRKNPPRIHGMPLTNRFLGGFFSLDGVHPSNTGHAMIANAFIDAANDAFRMGIQPIRQQSLTEIAAADPFIDWNGNLIVRGRPFTGLLETLGPFMGISGDAEDAPENPSARAARSKIDKEAGKAFMREYFLLKGRAPSTPWTTDDAIAAMHDVFRFR